jgi:pyridoxamine 5'-phosphate oxidase
MLRGSDPVAVMLRGVEDLRQSGRGDDGEGLREGDLAATWVEQFRAWLGDAVAAQVPEPNAMVLATATGDGATSARTVLLKEVDERGFVFYTNLQSRKGRQLAANPRASLVFGWYALHRQVLVDGGVQPVGDDDADAYFATRPRGAQIGAWASPQSTVLDSRETLEQTWAAVAQRHPGDTAIPRPAHWSGRRVVPDTVEFWAGRRDRLHDRLRYRRDGERWTIERLAP